MQPRPEEKWCARRSARFGLVGSSTTSPSWFALALSLALLLALSALGCGSNPHADAGTDAATDAPAMENGDLQIGTGESDFAPVVEGQTLLLARGCQGSQHVWISLRTRPTFVARGMVVSLDLVRASDGTRRSLEFLVRQTFDMLAEGNQLVGLTLQVPEPELTIGESLLVIANVRDSTGRVARASRGVRVVWGTETCSSF